MEFISLLILLPMFLSSSPEAPSDVPKFPNAPKIEVIAKGVRITPPEDASLAMTVLEYSPLTGSRGPASVAERRIDIVVEAP